MEYINIKELEVVDQISGIFDINYKYLEAIKEDIKQNGFDETQPIIVARGDWTLGSHIVLDGHTRLKAAQECGIAEVPVVFRDVESQDEAADLCIYYQRTRRNLTNKEIMRYIARYINRMRKRGRPSNSSLSVSNEYDSTKINRSCRSIFDDLTIQENAIKNNPPTDSNPEIVDTDTPPEKEDKARYVLSTHDIAKKIGVHDTVVKRIKQILTSGNQDIINSVESGDVSISTATELLQGKHKSDRSQRRMALVKEKGIKELQEALQKGNFTISGASEIARLPKAAQRALLKEFIPSEAVKFARMNNEKKLLNALNPEDLQAEQLAVRLRQFTKLRKGDNIADWSWNPITGCDYECKYCYAKHMVDVHYKEAIPDPSMRFKPRLRRELLSAPFNTMPPDIFSTQTSNKVLVSDMGDILSKSIPADWINEVIEVMRKTNPWTYIITTRNPVRYLDFQWPNNVWLGATANTPEKMAIALSTFPELFPHTRFLQIEPLIQEVSLQCNNLSVDWVIIGAQKKTPDCEPKQPQWEWIWEIVDTCMLHNIPLYWKDSIRVTPKSFPE